MKINTKFCLIIILTLLTFFSCCNNCFGYVFPDTNVDDYNYYLAFSYNVDDIYLITTNDIDFVVGHGSSQSSATIFYISNYNIYHLVDSCWVSVDVTSLPFFVNNRITFTPSSTLSMMYSNFDVKYDGYWSQVTGNYYFFPRTPVGVEMVKPMEVGGVPEMITNLLIILVPVGLIVFSIFLVVYLIASKKWLIH